MITTAHQELNWGSMALDVRTLPQRTKCCSCGEMIMMLMLKMTMMITKMRTKTTEMIIINIRLQFFTIHQPLFPNIFLLIANIWFRYNMSLFQNDIYTGTPLPSQSKAKLFSNCLRLDSQCPGLLRWMPFHTISVRQYYYLFSQILTTLRSYNTNFSVAAALTM